MGVTGERRPCPVTNFFDDEHEVCIVCGTPKEVDHDYTVGIVGTCNQKYELFRKRFSELNEDSKLEFLVSRKFEGDTQTVFIHMEDARVRNKGRNIELQDWLTILASLNVSY